MRNCLGVFQTVFIVITTSIFFSRSPRSIKEKTQASKIHSTRFQRLHKFRKRLDSAKSSICWAWVQCWSRATQTSKRMFWENWRIGWKVVGRVRSGATKTAGKSWKIFERCKTRTQICNGRNWWFKDRKQIYIFYIILNIFIHWGRNWWNRRRDLTSLGMRGNKRPPIFKLALKIISQRVRVIKVQGLKILGAKVFRPYFGYNFFFQIHEFFCFTPISRLPTVARPNKRPFKRLSPMPSFGYEWLLIREFVLTSWAPENPD